MKPSAAALALLATVLLAGCSCREEPKPIDPEVQRQQNRDAMGRSTQERDAALKREGQTGDKPAPAPAPAK